MTNAKEVSSMACQSRLARFSFWVDVMTDEEKSAMQALVDFWNQFVALGCHRSTDGKEVADAVHQIQSVFALRVARRVDPDIWA